MTDRVKLFVFSNTYRARVLLKCLECFIKKQDIEIILLSELGVSDNINIIIHTYQTLQQCIDSCTQVLIVCDDTIPKSKIDLVESMAKAQNKQHTIICDLHKAEKNHVSEMNADESVIDKPSILIVSYGAQTQMSCWEAIIYKLLYDNKLKVFASSSNEFKDMMHLVDLCDLAKENCNNMFVSEPECEVVVQSLSYCPNIDKNIENVCHQLKPDIIIVVICNNFYNYEEIRNVFKFRYGRQIDVFAKSELMEMNYDSGKQKLVFNFSQIDENQDTVMSLNDPSLLYNLSKVLLPKITLPDGVTII